VRTDALPSPDWLTAQVRRLERFAKQGDATETLRALGTIVPEYTGRPWACLPAATAMAASAPAVIDTRTAGLAT